MTNCIPQYNVIVVFCLGIELRRSASNNAIDSYAAGIGAGIYGDFSFNCGRYSDAYLRQRNLDSRMPGDPAQRRLTHAACSGAKTQDVIDDQFPDGNSRCEQPGFGKPPIATTTIGGKNMAEMNKLAKGSVH